jgi:hypothetical protein
MAVGRAGSGSRLWQDVIASLAPSERKIGQTPGGGAAAPAAVGAMQTEPGQLCHFRPHPAKPAPRATGNFSAKMPSDPAGQPHTPPIHPSGATLVATRHLASPLRSEAPGEFDCSPPALCPQLGKNLRKCQLLRQFPVGHLTRRSAALLRVCLSRNAIRPSWGERPHVRPVAQRRLHPKSFHFLFFTLRVFRAQTTAHPA